MLILNSLDTSPRLPVYECMSRLIDVSYEFCIIIASHGNDNDSGEIINDPTTSQDKDLRGRRIIEYFPTVIVITMTSNNDEEANILDNSKALVVYKPRQLHKHCMVV